MIRKKRNSQLEEYCHDLDSMNSGKIIKSLSNSVLRVG